MTDKTQTESSVVEVPKKPMDGSCLCHGDYMMLCITTCPPKYIKVDCNGNVIEECFACKEKPLETSKRVKGETV